MKISVCVFVVVRQIKGKSPGGLTFPAVEDLLHLFCTPKKSVECNFTGALAAEELMLKI